MSWNELSVLAIVPARGGSKGIPKKNLCTVGPMSLVGWAAKTVIECPWIDAAVLSTDSEEIAEEGRRHGLEVPFMRPAELSGDSAAAVDMWRHAWLASERQYARTFDLSILLQPTTPLRNARDVERTVRGLVEGGHRAAATVSRVPGHFVPQKCLTLDDHGIIGFFHADGAATTSRQAAPAYYYRNGVCYATTRQCLVENGHIVEQDCLAVEIDDYVVDIDHPIELEFAEYLYQRARSERLKKPKTKGSRT